MDYETFISVFISTEDFDHRTNLCFLLDSANHTVIIAMHIDESSSPIQVGSITIRPGDWERVFSYLKTRNCPVISE